MQELTPEVTLSSIQDNTMQELICPEVTLSGLQDVKKQVLTNFSVCADSQGQTVAARPVWHCCVETSWWWPMPATRAVFCVEGAQLWTSLWTTSLRTQWNGAASRRLGARSQLMVV